jgi:hypothetical protein
VAFTSRGGAHRTSGMGRLENEGWQAAGGACVSPGSAGSCLWITGVGAKNLSMMWVTAFPVRCMRVAGAACEAAVVSSAVSDGSGNVIVAGTFEGELDLGSVGVLESAGGTDGFVVKLTECCGDVIWANRVGGAGQDLVTGVSFGADRSVIVAGRAQGNVSAGMRPHPRVKNIEEWRVRCGAKEPLAESRVFSMQLCEATGQEQWFLQSTGSPFDLPQQRLVAPESKWSNSAGSNGTEAVRIAGFRGRGLVMVANIDADQPKNFAGKWMVGNPVKIGGKLVPAAGSRVYVGSFATSAAALSDGALLDEKLIKGVLIGVALSIAGMCVLACALRAFSRCAPKKLKANVRNKRRQLSKRLGRYGKLGLPRSRGDASLEEEKRLEAVYEDDAEYEYDEEEENGHSAGDHELEDIDPDKP